MKKWMIVVLMGFATIGAHADQYMTPDGNGGYIIHQSEPQTDWSMMGPKSSMSDMIRERQREEQQIKRMKLENELLKQKLERQKSGDQSQTSAPKANLSPAFRAWLADNPWFGRDRPRTEYANLYARELRRQQPTLVGRPFFDAVGAKVKEVFGSN